MIYILAVFLIAYFVFAAVDDWRNLRTMEKIRQRLDELEAQKLEVDAAFEKFKDELFSR